MNKRLELIWPNKDKVLLGLEENGKPIWGTKADLEPRLLVQLEAVAETNPDNLDDLYGQGDNLLIKGDNLLALKALERHFAGKIKCIYIDPPFNTGNAFEHYDDGLEHTIWLSMMKSRLEILRKLLREDGAIFVEIDDDMMPYLKVLMDEIFGGKAKPQGRKARVGNYIATIIWQKKFSPQSDARFFSDMHDYILVYARDHTKLKLNLLPRTEAADARYKNPDDDPRGPWTSGDLSVKTPNPDWIYPIITPSGREVWPPKSYSWRVSKRRLEEMIKDNRIWFGNKGGNVPRIKRFLSEVQEGLIPVTIWMREEVGDNQEAKREIKTVLPEAEEVFTTPKPERLIKRVIELATEPGDWVLDSFLGSGTTDAVAHKLGRKWIGVELGEHAETLCLPRLKKVQAGDDGLIVSKQVGWKGGGGFRYCVLGESLFTMDKDTGLVMINPKYTNGPLVAAVCNMEDFRLNNDSVFHGVRDSIYAHITEEKVNQPYLDAIVERLPNGKSLIVYCLKRTMNLKIPEEVKIKRIPKELQIPRYLVSSPGGDK
jgi:adenine-specific DNA-methyltransferase